MRENVAKILIIVFNITAQTFVALGAIQYLLVSVVNMNWFSGSFEPEMIGIGVSYLAIGIAVTFLFLELFIKKLEAKAVLIIVEMVIIIVGIVAFNALLALDNLGGMSIGFSANEERVIPIMSVLWGVGVGCLVSQLVFVKILEKQS